MANIIKNLAKPLALFSGLIGLSIIVPRPVQSAECATSGTLTGAEFDSTYSSDGMCYGTPDRYEITIYEMGLCTSAPISTTTSTNDTVDTDTNCTATTTGTWTGDLAGGASFDMSGGARPAAGTYTHAYIILGNEFGLNGKYALTDGGSTTTTYYSNGAASGSTNVDSTTGTATAVDFTETLTTFGGGSCDYDASEDFTTGSNPGTLTAVVTNASKVVQTSCGSGVKRIVGQFEPDTAFTISDSITGMTVTFTVTNSGMSVIGSGSETIDQLGSGPFSARFTFIE